MLELKEDALEQIKDKKYYISLQDRGIKDITFVGIVPVNMKCKKMIKENVNF